MLCQPAFTVTTSGPAPLTVALADALQAQWQLGFPRTPDGVVAVAFNGLLAAALHGHQVPGRAATGEEVQGAQGTVCGLGR